MKNQRLWLPVLATLSLSGCVEDDMVPDELNAQFREGTLLVTRSETVDSITTTNVYTIAPDGSTEQLTDVPRGTTLRVPSRRPTPRW